MALSSTDTLPKVTGEVEVRRDVDFTSCLDRWTLEEIEGYIDGDDDGEGRFYLAEDCEVLSEDTRPDVNTTELKAYAAWRRENNLTGRMGRDSE